MTDRWAFEVTQDDLDAMDADTFTSVWSALGAVLRGRSRVLNAAVRTLQAELPVREPVTSSVAAPAPFTCPDCGAVAKGGAGLSAHRRARHVAAKLRKGGNARIEEAKQAEHDAVTATAAAIRGREPQESHVNGQDFAARAAARHADAWAERHQA